ncbi:hypothetical protein GBAR_LOCUS18467 [Geodia barretti]|uniref:Uncharacterized protein n=1 Tax=Geodia barretti TaxID=519541 RepID=A0AA35WU00_GEOBA|nr:hypothetical protein GBAR_LOCUS18467 [Geodia barretti]
MGDVGIGGDHHQPVAVAGVRGQQVTTGAQLSQASFHEHGDDRPGGVRRVDYVGLVSQRTDEVAQLQPGCGLRPVSAGVHDLSVDAGDRLGRLIVLLVGQADGMRKAGEALLALVLVAEVVRSNTCFQVTQLVGFVLDQLRDVLAGGLGRRLHFCGHPSGDDQAAVELVVLFADLTHFSVFVPKVVRPVAGCTLGVVNGLQGILPGIPVNFPVVNRNAGDGFQFFGHGNGHRRIAVFVTRPYDFMSNLEHI